ncbi:MAG TPA: ParB N-terminal domain-containing protein [Firmicutes bacterium]|jgi:ParB-like chromosome segregation protein Spo0J|nr:ParB N-terminal domain-containing protein [Bacillota bacterium]
MIIKTIPVEMVKLHPLNPRKDLQPGDADFERLRRSIEAFGFVEPLVWNERTGFLVGGNQRFKVLLEQGAKEVTVSVVDLDEKDEQLLSIALNRVRGEWDGEKLVALLKEIAEMGADVTLTGFDPVNFDQVLIWPEEQDAEKKKKLLICPNCGHQFEA